MSNTNLQKEIQRGQMAASTEPAAVGKSAAAKAISGEPSAVPRVLLKRSLYEAIRKQAEMGLPNEICGYVSAAEPAYAQGQFKAEIRIAGVHPLRNVDASPEHYSFDPQEQFATLAQVQKAGGVLVGSYHSHPETPSRMSNEDIRLAIDASMLYGIYAVRDKALNFFIVQGQGNEREQAHRHAQAQKQVMKTETIIEEDD